MELSYNELTKKDVINVSDGRCLGRVTDIKLLFPQGKLVGIVVPGRKVRCIFKWFDKSEIYIEERKILKIGGDVILVDIRQGEEYLKPPKQPKCPPPCEKHHERVENFNKGISAEQFSNAFDDNDY